MLNKALIPNSRFAVAFSGGGDSTALVHRVRAFNPLVLIVDHALRDGSGAEAETAKMFAQRQGLEARVLRWAHDNPTTGLQEKARRARYGLMGQACRDAGITHLLTGHTEDDQAETLVMRYDRSTDWRGAAGIAEDVYAPVWPELAGVTLVRPLLGVTRAAIRDYNRRHGLTWVEDPSNENRGFTRIRARDYLTGRSDVRRHLLETASAMQEGCRIELARARSCISARVTIDAYGLVSVRDIPPHAVLERLLMCAAGTGGTVGAKSLRDLRNAMQKAEFSGGTLAGARVVRRGQSFLIGRDPVVVKGRANQPALSEVALPRDHAIIWDGRFKITSCHKGLRVKPYGHLDAASEGVQHLYPEIAHKFRQTLPIILDGDRASDISSSPHVKSSCLVAPRLHAMTGTPAD